MKHESMEEHNVWMSSVIDLHFLQPARGGGGGGKNDFNPVIGKQN